MEIRKKEYHGKKVSIALANKFLTCKIGKKPAQNSMFYGKNVKMWHKKIISNGLIKTALLWLLHLALAVTSFLFVQHTVRDFISKKTYFQTDTFEMTGEELPTYTFCFEHEQFLAYGSGFSVAKLYNSRSGHWINSILLTFHNQGSV